MNQILKNLSSILLIFFIISGIIILYQKPTDKPVDVSLSELVGEINQGSVSKIVVQNNDLSIELHDGKKQRTSKEPQSSLTETLTNYGVEKEKLNNVFLTVKEDSGASFWLAAILPILLPFLLIGAFIWFMMRQAQRGNSQALSFGTSRARMIDPKDKKKRVTFADVVGAEETKNELEEVVEFLKHPKKFLNMGAKIPKGVLLLGPPGTGKTLMAKAVAGEAGVPFFNISGSEFVEMFVGVGASRVRDLFKQAKKNAPAIVFIDEIDAVGRQRGTGLGGGHDEREQTLNQILVEMDGFETDLSVIVIAATNRPDVLDPALLRPGRFDRRVTMDLPDINEREQILVVHSKNKPLEKTVTLRTIAERTPGFSGADLANLLNEGAILATRRNRKTISIDELTESIEKVILGPERRGRAINTKEREIIAYHEGGHALVGASLPYADPVQKVSIISRGHAGGYTLSVPSEDKSLHSHNYFLDELAVFLGGYASEKMVFGDITTGPSNDLERATQMARQMVTRYGMSKLGARTFGKKTEMVFLGKDMHEERDYSEKTAQDIDVEISLFIEQAFQRATNILTTKRDVLNRIAQALLEKETLEKEAFDAIVNAPSTTEKG
ncbi:MAG: ATP-dependent zinc metalloprotease FtsH [Minisyncoccota bacterium]